jgi:hypothetical protein
MFFVSKNILVHYCFKKYPNSHLAVVICPLTMAYNVLICFVYVYLGQSSEQLILHYLVLCLCRPCLHRTHDVCLYDQSRTSKPDDSNADHDFSSDKRWDGMIWMLFFRLVSYKPLGQLYTPAHTTPETQIKRQGHKHLSNYTNLSPICKIYDPTTLIMWILLAITCAC